MCKWKDRQQYINAIIYHFATMYHLNCDQCSTQYGLFRNDPSLKEADVKSLPSLVAFMHFNQLHELYKAIYQLSRILLTIPVSSVSCEKAFRARIKIAYEAQ